MPEEQHVQALMQLCDVSTSDVVRVRCTGALACLAQNPAAVDANRVVADYLLSLLPSPSGPSPVSTEVMIQAVSALIDIYSDERLAYDVNFRNGGYIDRLAGAVDGVKKATKAVDKKKERELRIRAEETRDNLVAFIKYRRSLKL